MQIIKILFILLISFNSLTIFSQSKDTANKSSKKIWTGYISLGGLFQSGNTNKISVLGKGELRREIAHIMSTLSNPTPKDVVLDPFAGYGAIPLERAQNFPYREIIAIEKDDYLVSRLKQKVRTVKKNINVLRGDALVLSEIKNSSIDKIITDPPWGEYKEISNISIFYRDMLREFVRILRPDGVVVILISAKEIFESILQDQFSQIFKIKSKYDILVSGKKAAIYQLIRKYGN